MDLTKGFDAKHLQPSSVATLRAKVTAFFAEPIALGMNRAQWWFMFATIASITIIAVIQYRTLHSL